MTITLWHCEHTAYSRFAQFHYMPDTDRCRVCRCYLALVDGKCVGFVAAMHSGYGCWRAHKTVVTLPKDHPGYFTLWAKVADAQAELHLKEGHRFTVVAPADHAAYRDASPLWKVTVRDARQRKKGNRSHEYVGLEPAPIPAPIPDPTLDPTLDPTPDSKPDPDLIERIADSRLYNENCYDAMTRGVDASTLIKGLTRDRRNSDEMKAILKAGGAEYQGKKIMGSANDPYIQRWTRQEVKDAITWCGAHIETMYSEEAKARLAIELAEAGGPS